MKKLTSLFLSALLSLSLFAFGPFAPIPPQEPDPIPVETIRPGEPPVEPQDDLPDPVEIPWDD